MPDAGSRNIKNALLAQRQRALPQAGLISPLPRLSKAEAPGPERLHTSTPPPPKAKKKKPSTKAMQCIAIAPRRASAALALLFALVLITLCASPVGAAPILYRRDMASTGSASAIAARAPVPAPAPVPVPVPVPVPNPAPAPAPEPAPEPAPAPKGTLASGPSDGVAPVNKRAADVNSATTPVAPRQVAADIFKRFVSRAYGL